MPVNVRSRSGQPCSLCRAGDLRVLLPARRIHIRLRGRVLRTSPHPASVRSAAAPTVTALGTSGRVRRGARGLGLSPAPCAAAPVVFAAIRVAMLRRRDTGFLPCDVSHRASDEPRRCMSLSSALAPSSLASLFIRRVFFVASALVDVPSTRLTLPATDLLRFSSMSPFGALTTTVGRRVMGDL